jgi:hypothetical protein
VLFEHPLVVESESESIRVSLDGQETPQARASLALAVQETLQDLVFSLHLLNQKHTHLEVYMRRVRGGDLVTNERQRMQGNHACVPVAMCDMRAHA